VPVPMPSDFATSKMPTPLRKILSHLPLGLAVDLRPAELHALSNRSLEAGFDSLANYCALKLSERTG